VVLGPDVEPHRGIERGLLRDQQVGELLGEDPRVRVAREVVVLDPPAGDRVDHPGDHVPHGGLALRGPERPAEVLLGHDVRGVLRPVLRELDVPLLEGVAAFLEVRDDGVARLPFDLVERMGPVLREIPLEGEAVPLHRNVAFPGRHDPSCSSMRRITYV